MRRSDYKNNVESNAGREPHRLDTHKEFAWQETTNQAVQNTSVVSAAPAIQRSSETSGLYDAMLAMVKQTQGVSKPQQVTPAQDTPKKNKVWLIALSIAVLLICAVVVTVFVWKPWETQEEKPVETTQATTPHVETTAEATVTEKTMFVPLIEEDINSIFANEERSDVVDECSAQWVSSMYERISDAEMNGEDITDVRTRIQTIELFLQHKRTLEGLDNEEQPLNAGIIETVQGIKVATELYYESGLKNTINLKVQGIMDDYDLYSSLKAELDAITDYATYDVAAGSAKVNLIKHKPNRDELSVMLEIVSSNQDLINAELAIAELAESEDEEAKTAANNTKAAIEDILASLAIKLQKAHALVEGEEFVEPTTEYTESTEATGASEVTEASEKETSEPTESNEEGSSEP